MLLTAHKDLLNSNNNILTASQDLLKSNNDILTASQELLKAHKDLLESNYKVLREAEKSGEKTMAVHAPISTISSPGPDSSTFHVCQR